MGLFGLKVGSNRHSHAHDQQQPQHQHQNQLPGLGSYPLHRPLHPQQHLPPPGINHLHKDLKLQTRILKVTFCQLDLHRHILQLSQLDIICILNILNLHHHPDR